MAHGDYACCAVCDCKMYYDAFSGDVKTKLCSACAVDLAKDGVYVSNGDELIDWMKKNSTTAKVFLREHGFNVCYYKNEVDETFKKLPEGEE
jgi:DNA gyrase/topoisomerase IV subunit B